MTNNIPNHVTIKKLKDLGCQVKINHYRFFRNRIESFARREISEGYGPSWANAQFLNWKDVLPRMGTTTIEIQLPNGQTVSKNAVCSKKDNFCKKLGLKIALNRALNSVISDDGTLLLSDFVNSKATDVGTTSVVAKI